MSNGIQFRITATKEQLEELERMCELTEHLMAETLARRIEGLKAEEAFPFIVDWFKSVRHMAHGAWISCNIQAQSAPIGATAPEDMQALIKQRHSDRMNRVVAALGQMDITMKPGQLEVLFNALR